MQGFLNIPGSLDWSAKSLLYIENRLLSSRSLYYNLICGRSGNRLIMKNVEFHSLS